MTTTNTTHLLKLKDAAKALDVHPLTLRRWIARGVIAAVDTNPAGKYRQFRVPADAIATLKAAR